MRVIDVPIKDIYVPSAKAKTLDEENIMPLAEDILENGQKTPIYVRKGKDRWVLQEGLHRLEAVTVAAEKRDWVWGGVTLVAVVVMTVLAYKVHVLHASLDGLREMLR